MAKLGDFVEKEVMPEGTWDEIVVVPYMQEEEIKAADDSITLVADLQEKINSAAQQDSIDPLSVEIAEIAVESIRQRLKISKPTIFPGIEQFSDHKRSFAATEIALEGLGTFLVELWTKLRELVSDAIDSVIKFIKNIFDNTEKLEESNKSLEKRVAALPANAKPKAKNIAVEDSELDLRAPSVFRAFNLRGVVGEMATIMIMQNHKQLLVTVGKDATEAVSNVSVVAGQISRQIHSLTPEHVTDTIELVNRHQHKLMVFKNLSHGRTVREVEDEPDLPPAIEVIHSNVDTPSSGVPVLSMNGINELIKLNREIISELGKVKNYEPKLLEAKHNFEKLCKLISEGKIGVEDEDKVKLVSYKLNKVRMLIRKDIQRVIKFFGIVPKLTNEALVESMKYCNISVHAYE